MFDVSNSALRSPKDIDWDKGNIIQGLNRCTPQQSVIQSMDWLSIASIIDEKRLGIFGRILYLKPSSIYKKVAWYTAPCFP